LSPGSGYQWDPHWNLDTAPLAPVPAALLPREPEPRPAAPRPMLPTSGLSPYADGALDRACRAIIVAPCGEQETTLHNESFAIGTLAAAGGVPVEIARRALLNAARRLKDYDQSRPWRAVELDRKVDRSFAAGMQHPREARHG
jgi:hypothetical protein